MVYKALSLRCDQVYKYSGEQRYVALLTIVLNHGTFWPLDLLQLHQWTACMTLE